MIRAESMKWSKGRLRMQQLFMRAARKMRAEQKEAERQIH